MYFFTFKYYSNFPDAVEYKSVTADANADGGASSKPFTTFETRSFIANESVSIEETAVSILLKLKFFPFRKTSSNSSVLEARLDAGAKDNGVWGAGIDFGLPDGSGFGYGEDANFKTFSFSSVSYIFQ
jgi:hypothetical protein